jgi:hypothetical protein
VHIGWSFFLSFRGLGFRSETLPVGETGVSKCKGLQRPRGITLPARRFIEGRLGNGALKFISILAGAWGNAPSHFLNIKCDEVGAYFLRHFLKLPFALDPLALLHTWLLMFTLFKPHLSHARRNAFSTLFPFSECMIVPI